MLPIHPTARRPSDKPACGLTSASDATADAPAPIVPATANRGSHDGVPASDTPRIPHAHAEASTAPPVHTSTAALVRFGQRIGLSTCAYGSTTARIVARTAVPHSGQTSRTERPFRSYRHAIHGSVPARREASEIDVFDPASGSLPGGSGRVGSGMRPNSVPSSLAPDPATAKAPAMSDAIARLRRNIAKVYLGSPAAIDQVICCLLARGHLLIEDLPGVGKTVLASALARSIDGSFNRIQLTPDLLPTDVLGVSIYDRNSGTFRFSKGPIFANVILADEINRTTPRTQTAMLEAMNEATVSIDGQTHRLEQPFMVVATQNPYDFEGTYLLPENQLDRFLMRIRLGYPSPEQEARILTLRPAMNELPTLEPAVSKAEVLSMQDAVDGVRLDDTLLQYIITLAGATRRDPDLQVGLSPRGSLALAQAARATAVVNARNYVIPEDILGNVQPVCAHRVIPIGGLGNAGAAAGVLERLIERVPSPV
jgi:MoxR-like ATPase